MDACIEAIAGLGAGDLIAIEPIKHGLTNHSWRVRTTADQLIVRLSSASPASLQIDRHSEARVLQIAAHAGVGPYALRCDPQRGLLVTRDLGPTWTEADAQHEDNITRIAGVLRRLHALSVPEDVRRVDLDAVARGYLRTLDERGMGRGIASAALREAASMTAAKLGKDSTPRLCHNDVHHLNIIEGITLRLIDWEYAGVGEPMFDLASVCIYHRYSKSQRERLLSAYGPAAAVTWQRLDLACWLFDYIRDLWLAVREGEAD